MFVPDANSFCEGGLSAVDPIEEGEEWKGDDAAPDLQSLVDQEDRQRIKGEFSITDEEVDTLLKTGNLDIPFVLCPTCLEDDESSDSVAETL